MVFSNVTQTPFQQNGLKNAINTCLRLIIAHLHISLHYYDHCWQELHFKGFFHRVFILSSTAKIRSALSLRETGNCICFLSRLQRHLSSLLDINDGIVSHCIKCCSKDFYHYYYYFGDMTTLASLGWLPISFQNDFSNGLRLFKALLFATAMTNRTDMDFYEEPAGLDWLVTPFLVVTGITVIDVKRYRKSKV